jgi:hypothetical protein
VIEQVNARLENPVAFGVAFGVLYFLFRVFVGHATPADALVSSFYAAALALLARLFMNRMKAARK